MLKKLCLLAFIPAILLSCGGREHKVVPSSSSLGLAAGDLSSVSFSLVEDSETIDPSAPPLVNSGLSTLKVSFRATIDRTNYPGFVYNKDNWKIGFQKVGEVGNIISLGSADTVTSSGGTSLSGNVSAVDVTLTAALGSGSLPADVATILTATETAGRREILLVAIYREGADSTSSDRTVKMTWTSDLGVMVNGPTAGVPTVSDENAVLRWSPPSDKSAVMRDNTGVLVSAGTSSVGGYLVAYWDVAACGAAGAEWMWATNSQLDSTGTSRVLSTCSFAASAAAQTSDSVSATACSLGCSSDVGSGSSGKSEDDVAIPAYVPTTAEVGTVVSVGCYKVIRVAARSASGESSVALQGVSNDKYYGAVVYALDSSGHVSLGRSACMFAKPTVVPLPADGLSGGAKKSKSDCFVATAASGRPDSRAVHYWRVIRDRMIGNSAFVAWYYRNGPELASWLDAHSGLKPSVSFVLENSGRLIVSSERFLSRVSKWFAQSTSRALSALESIFVSEAHAEESPSPSVTRELETVSSHIQVSVGQVDFTTKGPLWDSYYRAKGKPKKLFLTSLSSGYSIWNGRLGELGLGMQGSYFSAQGEVPARLPDGSVVDSKVAGTNHVAYAMTALGMVDVRARIPYPWLSWFSPRFSYLYGLSRLRMEAQASNDLARTSGSEDTWPAGYTMLKQMSVMRLAGECYFGGFLHQEVSEMRSSYGLQDFGVSLFYEIWSDRSKSISMDSNVMGAGLSLLFL
jgi:hypothetical protein